MKWNEIREAYPNSFVLLKALTYHIDGDKKYIDNMALVKIIDNVDKANRTLVRCKGDCLHTAGIAFYLFRGVIAFAILYICLNV